MAGADETVRVLSIQSHVVHGYVGNRSAVFPLQILGFEVDAINSVQFCNHTWYKVFKGQVMNSDDLETIYDGLKSNGLHKYDYILTGYIGSESFLLKVCDMIKEMKHLHPDLKYVCDPVMGDDGVMYVPEGLLPIYQDNVLPLADVILPNQWEAELLSGSSITSEAEALAVMRTLQGRGPTTVVLTSSTLAQADSLVSFASSHSDGVDKCVRMEFSKLDCMFIGSGDLFAALWLAWSHVHPGQLKLTASKVQSTMQHVLKRTVAHAEQQAGKGNKPDWAQVELRLVQSKRDIENPQITVQAEEMTL